VISCRIENASSYDELVPTNIADGEDHLEKSGPTVIEWGECSRSGDVARSSRGEKGNMRRVRNS